MKFCRFCGAECRDDATFCPECGKNIDSTSANGGQGTNQNASQEDAYEKMINTGNMNMVERNIVMVLILSIITCGIYSLYWTYVTAEALNEEDKTTPELMNYVIAILLGIVTCGIFTIYWNYTFYKKSDVALNSNNFLINFILSIFGFSIVSTLIVQSDINKYVE